MALIVKPVPVTTPSSTVNRPTSAVRGGQAASLSGPVDAMNPVSGSGLGDGAFSSVISQDDGDFSGHSFSPGSKRSHSEGLPDPKTGIVEFTSQGFAELLELRDTMSSGSIQIEGKNRGKAEGMGMELASSLYEAVIDIAAGNKNLRGETVSITL